MAVANFFVVILFVTGGLVLGTDLRFYKREKMKKEQKVAKILAWTNIFLGIMVFVSNWVYQQFLW
ncbi:CLC_0170 family protein [Bacillus sp. DJP31]|uniref:CLC_0170 family protein n=1 Tax=Bacillus sp. DJP31 TaxID=3409789 RepID=UPI003BB59624